MIRKLLLAVIPLTFYSCAHTIHYGNVQNVPAFKEADETQVSVGFGTQFSVSGLYATGAYSLNDYLGVIASSNYIFSEGGSQENQTDHKRNGFYGDLGFGFYKPMGSHFIFENYLGYGHGSISNNVNYVETMYEEDPPEEYEIPVHEFSKFKYHKIFNQTSITFFSNNDVFEASYSMRFSQLRYHYIDAQMFNSNTQMYDMGEFDDLLARPNYFIMESQFTTRYKFYNFKVEGYVGYALPVHENTNRFFNFNFGFRYIYTFPLFFKK